MHQYYGLQALPDSPQLCALDLVKHVASKCPEPPPPVKQREAKPSQPTPSPAKAPPPILRMIATRDHPYINILLGLQGGADPATLARSLSETTSESKEEKVKRGQQQQQQDEAAKKREEEEVARKRKAEEEAKRREEEEAKKRREAEQRRQDEEAAARKPRKIEFRKTVALHLLGYSTHLEGLMKLYMSKGDEFSKWCAEYSKNNRTATGGMPVMQGSAAPALRKREEELNKMQVARKTKPRELHSPMNRKGCQFITPCSDVTQLYDVSGAIVEDNDLRELFETYDRDGNGYISRSEFKDEYRTFENYGLEMTDDQLDAIFTQFGGSDDRLQYDEFCVLMLQRARM